MKAGMRMGISIPSCIIYDERDWGSADVALLVGAFVPLKTALIARQNRKGPWQDLSLKQNESLQIGLLTLVYPCEVCWSSVTIINAGEG